MKKIYLIDVSSMFFRAFYAVRPLSSPAGVPVNAIYGFLSMISKLLKDEKPEYMVFCYDRKEPSFRKNMYAEYKAHRTEMPEDLAQQIPYIKKLADYLGVPSLEVPEYEADDLIGTLTKFGRRQNMEVVIVSGDKDFGQLIEEHVVLYDTMKDIRYDIAGVVEKWGIQPSQFIDYLAIVGDTSDNIPGVRGIGEKGAIKLIEQFENLENIYANLEKIESKSIKQKLIDAHEMALLSKKLVTIVCDVPVPEDVANYRLQDFKVDELRALLQELNFKTFEKNLLGGGATSALPTATPPGQSAGTTAEVSADSAGERSNLAGSSASNATAKKAKASKKKSVVEPGSIHEQQQMEFGQAGSEGVSEFTEKSLDLAGIKNWLKPADPVWGFCDDQAVYLHRGEEVMTFVGDLSELGPFTDFIHIMWSGFDLKHFWHKINAKKPRVTWDSQLAAYAVKAADCSDFKKVFNREVGANLPEQMTPSQTASAHLRLQTILAEKMREQQSEKVYRELDLPLPEILLAMEDRGVRIDSDLLAKQSAGLEKDISSLEKQIHEAAGEAFNIASPKQLGVILFDKLKLPTTKKTKTGFSTDNEVLEALPHVIGKMVLQYRELAKLKSTYVDALPQMTSVDGRVHTSFNQALTTTGRLSSTNPNLQNIPIRTERGQQVRKAFIAAPGMKLLSVDYSQIELRILAHISEDPNLIRAFTDDLDIHAATAAEIFSVPLAEVTSDLRRSAKAVNFGIAYGQGAFGLAENLGIGRSEAQSIIKRYFERFANVRDYIDNTIKQAHEMGYVETLFGRRRYIEELRSSNMAVKKGGERAAINAPIQGTASDLVKKAMIDLHRELPVAMLLQVHDELIFEAKEEVLRENLPRIVQIMEGVAQYKVPLKVNYSIGDNWDEAH